MKMTTPYVGLISAVLIALIATMFLNVNRNLTPPATSQPPLAAVSDSGQPNQAPPTKTPVDTPSPSPTSTSTTEPAMNLDESDTYAEPFVKNMAFVPASNSVIYSVHSGYPGGRVIFRQNVNSVSNTLEVTASAFIGLDNLVGQYLSVESDESSGIIAVEAGMEGGNVTVESDIFISSVDGVTLTNITNGLFDIASYWVIPNSGDVMIHTSNGRIVRIDSTTAVSEEIASGVLNAVGAPGTSVEFSRDGNLASFVTRSDYDEYDISVLNIVSSTWTTVAVVHVAEETELSGAVFNESGDELYYSSCSTIPSAPNTIDLPSFECALMKTDIEENATPVFLVQLETLTGKSEERVGKLVWIPSGTKILFRHDDGIYSIDSENLTAGVDLLSHVNEHVVSQPIVTEYDEEVWVGYVVETDMSTYSHPYTDYTGEQVRRGAFAHIITIP